MRKWTASQKKAHAVRMQQIWAARRAAKDKHDKANENLAKALKDLKPKQTMREFVINNPVVFDSVNHPKHYTTHPSGIECIQITEHMNFNLGNAIKYLWRADQKGDYSEQLRKAKWYIEREIARVSV